MMMMSDSIKSVQVVVLAADVCSLGYVTLIMRLIWYSDWAIIQQTFKHSPPATSVLLPLLARMYKKQEVKMEVILPSI